MREYNGNQVLAGLVLVLASLSAQAGVAYKNQTYDDKQPNGEVLKVRVVGNSYYAEVRTADGSLIVYDAAKKGCCYAEVNAAGDALVSTGVLATNTKMRASNTVNKQQPGLSDDAKAKRAKERYQKMHGHTPQAANEKVRKAFAAIASTGISPHGGGHRSDGRPDRDHRFPEPAGHADPGPGSVVSQRCAIHRFWQRAVGAQLLPERVRQ